MKSGDSQNFRFNQHCLRKKKLEEKKQDSNSLVPLHLRCRVTKSAGVAVAVAGGHDKSRGSNLISNSSRTKK